jgi:organic radical activating enzyme
MNIQGLQKTTLLDYPGKIAATVFTGGCNFRCPFCHNASLVLNDRDAQDISEEVFFDFWLSEKDCSTVFVYRAGSRFYRERSGGLSLKLSPSVFWLSSIPTAVSPPSSRSLSATG